MIDDPDDSPDDGDDLARPLEGPPEERPTRGLLWVFLPALAGAVLGAALGAWNWLRPSTTLPRARESLLNEVTSEGVIGTIIGLAAGAMIWAFFPYKRAAAEQGENAKRVNPAPDASDPTSETDQR